MKYRVIRGGGMDSETWNRSLRTTYCAWRMPERRSWICVSFRVVVVRRKP